MAAGLYGIALMASSTASSEKRQQATAIPVMRAYDGPATRHRLKLGDARDLGWIEDDSVHLVVTSPPYFNLKKYNDHDAQMGDIDEYEHFCNELNRVWAECYRVLVPGGRVVCVVGDVCVARRQNKGRHHVIPLHADISVGARSIGFDYLTPILWNKIANASFEASGNGGGFLGKPYEPNAIVKNDVEYILMLRKHGAYRKPSDEQRATSRLSKEEQSAWFRPIWTDVTGASTRNHPAPYPEALAYRLIRMFSFTEDVVLDPFGGTGTTSVAAMKCDRSSIYNEVDPDYHAMATSRVMKEARQGTIGRPAPELIFEPSRSEGTASHEH